MNEVDLYVEAVVEERRRRKRSARAAQMEMLLAQQQSLDSAKKQAMNTGFSPEEKMQFHMLQNRTRALDVRQPTYGRNLSGCADVHVFTIRHNRDGASASDWMERCRDAGEFPDYGAQVTHFCEHTDAW